MKTQKQYEKEFNKMHGSSSQNKDDENLLDITKVPEVTQMSKLERVHMLSISKQDFLDQIERAEVYINLLELELEKLPSLEELLPEEELPEPEELPELLPEE